MHNWQHYRDKMKNRAEQVIGNKRNLVIIYVVFALAASIQLLTLGSKRFHEGGKEYTSYNNYVIFKQSFYHLKSNKDLYVLYLDEHFDLYKYTPTFSVFFGIPAMLPDWLGLNVWNLLNALLLLAAIYYLPRLNNLQKGWTLIIILIELMTSMQNAQSNALIAGLIIFAFGFLENRRYLFATFCIVCSVYIKLFGIVGFALFLLYPDKLKLGLYTALWAVILFIPPLLFVDINQYMALFQSYGNLLFHDHSSSYGYSVMGWLNSWFGLDINKNIIVLIGMVLFLIPFIRAKMYKNAVFKLLALCSILLWVVIFNHKAESPTFVIAVSGVALWFISSEKSPFNIALFVSAFVLTILSPTDLFPRALREAFVVPYVLKALPCILIWLKIIYDMIGVERIKEANQYNVQGS